jgi:hypothetical protein
MRIAVVFLMGGLAGCVSDAAPTAKVAPPEHSFREITATERKVLATTLAKNLKDPDSTRWEWVPIRSDVKDGTVDYCGRVNSRNGYGGYAGSHVYTASITFAKGTVTGGTIGMIATDDVEPIFINTCRNQGLPVPT